MQTTETTGGRRPFSVCNLALFLLVLVVAVGAIFYLVMLKEIDVVVGDDVIQVDTFAKTVGEVLAEAGVELEEADAVSAALDSVALDRQTIEVYRAFDIEVEVDGEVVQVHSAPISVAQALELAGVELGPDDVVSHPVADMVEEPTRICVQKLQQEIEVVTETLAPGIERYEDAELSLGQTRVIREGKAGVVEKTIRVSSLNGEEVKREVLESRVVEEPQNTIIAYGRSTLASREDNDFRYQEVKTVEATAYHMPNSRTATGTIPRVGVIAVDPEVIPLGSVVYVEGYGFAVAEDTGGAIKGDRIDIYLDSEEECIQWGRRDVTIYIIEYGK